ncbi:hypothetical protein D9Q98_006362 [Chlorella vulgaris]|uniref:Uncharacterized protein n=1 Tax=Chlorella vulgaris TaxID=3077 RepID=A0A9D4TK46_CHLVU|nr:hypothetical protein D9Q98_006362 [Chlorella vulgaris]
MLPSAPLSDRDYSAYFGSLQQENRQHVCTRLCEFKQVFGNMFYCSSSGQAHVCDQNCNQRIFYDHHNEICRLSRRMFPRCEPPMHMARKRSGEEAEPEMVKRTQSADWRHQQLLKLQQQQVVAAVVQQQPPPAHQQQFGTWAPPAPQPAPPQGWTC